MKLLVGTIIILLFIWDLYWRGIALWKAARNKDVRWFIALLIINSVGILPLLYLYVFGQSKKLQSKKK